MRLRVVTAIRHDSARHARTLESWERHLDPRVPVTVYVDAPVGRVHIPRRMRWEDMTRVRGWTDFVERVTMAQDAMQAAGRPAPACSGHLYDAVPFFVLHTAIAESRGTGERLVWLDAGVIMEVRVDRKDLSTLVPRHAAVAYARGSDVADLGILVVDPDSDTARRLIARAVAFYREGEWLAGGDRRAGAVFDRLRRAMETPVTKPVRLPGEGLAFRLPGTDH